MGKKLGANDAPATSSGKLQGASLSFGKNLRAPLPKRDRMSPAVVACSDGGGKIIAPNLAFAPACYTSPMSNAIAVAPPLVLCAARQSRWESRCAALYENEATGDVITGHAIIAIRSGESIDLASLKELAARVRDLASELYVTWGKSDLSRLICCGGCDRPSLSAAPARG